MTSSDELWYRQKNIVTHLPPLKQLPYISRIFKSTFHAVTSPALLVYPRSVLTFWGPCVSPVYDNKLESTCMSLYHSVHSLAKSGSYMAACTGQYNHWPIRSIIDNRKHTPVISPTLKQLPVFSFKTFVQTFGNILLKLMQYLQPKEVTILKRFIYLSDSMRIKFLITSTNLIIIPDIN